MAEEKTNKALDDITGIVDNMGKIVTNANTIFAQLAESLSKTGVSFDTLSSDMAGVMPNIRFYKSTDKADTRLCP